MSCSCTTTQIDAACPTNGEHADPDRLLETLLMASVSFEITDERGRQLHALYTEIRNWPSERRQEIAEAVARRMRDER